MKRHAYVLLAVLVWLLPATGMISAAVFSPDVVTGKSRPATVQGATTQSNGLLPATTVIRTTTGMWAVKGAVSVQRGQRLYVRKSAAHGLQACTVDGVVCMDLAGRFAGELQRVAAEPALAHDVRQRLKWIAGWWFFAGGLIVVVVALVGWNSGDPRRE